MIFYYVQYKFDIVVGRYIIPLTLNNLLIDVLINKIIFVKIL